ncbi:gamma-glutamylcyclotransferase family protein [Cyanobacterium aponinum]|uniref:Gamma-glutamylcyclotransferase n=1 Tax=Cyanobacterium aponinum 0216 TaxID=2676140 RepID=A0A844GSB8_9CHRO|nr:gamma-glutamylcyclotransferase [Cyanobacterium aponinum]MTF39404.1 gamma-glutamylcyclotransferase [Cyanobacterium aponinum 0216]
MLKVFVYGTLKPSGKYYKIYCQGKTINEVKCWTKGKLYDLPLGYPAMTEGEEKVYGYLLSFASFKHLSNLDKLEGYTGIDNSPLNEYERRKITVYNDDNQPIDEAWCYFMNDSAIASLNGVFLPSGWWEFKRAKEKLRIEN